MENFSRAEFQPVLPMSCLRGQKPHKNIYDHIKKISARVAEVKFQPGQGMFAFITQTKMASAGSTPNLNLSQTSDKSSKQRFKWNDGDKIDNLLTVLQNH